MEQLKVELQEWMGSDRAIANAAWTSSFDKEKRDARSDEDVARIVKMLIMSGHATPVESVVFRFWINMPIFTDRQHMTHRVASHNGLSGRYRTMPDDFYRLPKDVLDILYKAGLVTAEEDYNDTCKLCYSLYNDWLDVLKDVEVRITNAEYKRAREVLRGVLPTSGMTERTTVINLRSFANYQRLRNSDHAQPEIAEVAKQMLNEVRKANICPVALEALEEKGWVI